MTEQEIAKRYRSLSEIDHVLQKPGMWVGDVGVNTKTFIIFDTQSNHMIEKELEYIPGFLKIVDEIISNSVDEHRRETNLGLDTITVQLIGSDTIRVIDNGGIPVAVHPETGTYIPEFIFGNLRTSSNYNEEDERTGVGTNGVGSALTNILSDLFEVVTADGKKKCVTSWSNNMKVHEEPTVSKCKEHFTQITFKPSLSFFKLAQIPSDFTHILRKRCIDAAAGTVGLKVGFEIFADKNTKLSSEIYEFEDFKQYIKLYDGLIDYEQVIYDSIPGKWEFAIVPESNIDVGFVNGASCNSGTHIRLLQWWTESIVSDYLKSKYKLDISNRVINSNYSIFVKLNVINPSYDSQTKERLTTNDYHFDKSGTYHKITYEFKSAVQQSNLVLNLVDWYKQKEEAEQKRELRKINKELRQKTQIAKLVEANSRDRSECELWLFEGDSAETGFRKNRQPQTQASYKLRGVVKNTLGKSESAIFSNKEFSDLIAAIGLKFGGNDPSKLRYGKIIICTDMDVDGNKIASLLLAFFYDHFPELIEAGMIYRALAPIIIANKGSSVYRFFTLADYRAVADQLEGYRIKYVKGHGGLRNEDYKAMLVDKHLIRFTIDENTHELIHKWFSGSSRNRKELMMEGDTDTNE